MPGVRYLVLAALTPLVLACCGGSGLIETAGIDYILPYWMARYYNVVSN